MKRLIYTLAKLYPRWWRDRYRAEFDALIEDEPASLRAAANVLSGALLMQMRTWIRGEPYHLREVQVLGRLVKNWWLLALAGAMQAVISAIYLVMQNEHGPLTFYAWHGMVACLGKLGLAAGVCIVAAGFLGNVQKAKCWLLVLNGVALAGLGLIQFAFVYLPIRFLTIALLIIVMAASIGILQLRIAGALRRQRLIADVRALVFGGAVAIGFDAAFLALGFGWIKLQPGSHRDLLCLGLFFSFSAICMFGSALRLHSKGFLEGQ